MEGLTPSPTALLPIGSEKNDIDHMPPVPSRIWRASLLHTQPHTNKFYFKPIERWQIPSPNYYIQVVWQGKFFLIVEGLTPSNPSTPSSACLMVIKFFNDFDIFSPRICKCPVCAK